MHRTIALVFVVAFLLAALIVEPASASVGVENTWTQKAPMQQARGNLGVAVVNGKIYAIGGCDKNGSESDASSTNEQYDPSSDQWCFKASMPVPSEAFAVAVWNGKIYCFSPTLTQVYDPQTDTWENKTAMPTARGSLQANTIGDKIYLVGGNKPGNYPSLSLNEAYDPATDTWTTKAPMLFAASAYASAVFNDKLYIFGSDKYSANNLTEIYDPETNSWSLGASSPIDTPYAKASVTSGVYAPPRIYLFDVGEQNLPSAQEYDPETDTWTTGITQPTSRSCFDLAVVNDLIYAIGGFATTGTWFPVETYTITPLALNEVFTPFGYGTVHYTPSPTSVPTETPQPTASATPIANNEQIQTPAVVAVAAAVAVAVGAGLAVFVWKRVDFRRKS